MKMGNELIDIDVILLHETELAILIEYDGDEIWLLKSQVEYEKKVMLSKITVTMPTWLAEKHDLIPE